MELTLDQALQKGVEAHKAGKVQEADRYYTAILKANPKHSDANHNMGVLAVGVGKVQEALPFFETALEANPSIAQFWLSYIDALIKLNRIEDAKIVLGQAKSKGAKGDGFDQVEKQLVSSVSKNSNIRAPSKEQFQSLVNLYTKGQYQEALNKGSKLLEQFPNSFNLYNIIGAANKGLGKLEAAIECYKKALSIKPDYAEAYSNMGLALQNQGKLEEAIEAYTDALAIRPDFAEAYNNMGNVLKDQGKLELAIEAFIKALSIKADSAEAYNNMGLALRDQGKVQQAIEAYIKALSIKPDFAEAYNSMGIALKDQGKLEEAIEAFKKALSIKPEYADAHHNLSTIKKYTVGDEQFLQVQELYKGEDLSEDDRCHLSFALAKMHEDIGELDQAFKYLSEGNSLCKKLLNYSIEQDEKLFKKLKEGQPKLAVRKIEIKEVSFGPKPIFILGMPRSGTTLVEQIISSHSEVTGAGELNHVYQFGANLALNQKDLTQIAVSEFRDRCLAELSKVSNGKSIVTDKMPHNFLFIPLICAAFPEAKIIHVQRNAAATCWSNYKKYFVSDFLGYCHDLKDVVDYYNLYRDLMKFWQSNYDKKIYNLNYEKLTTEQEKETRKLIKHLDLNWEKACLSPHKNTRSVGTASQLQVRQKVYKGSSKAWRKYEPFLKGVFDSLPSS